MFYLTLARLIRTRVDTDNQHFKLHVIISMQDNVALRTLRHLRVVDFYYLYHFFRRDMSEDNICAFVKVADSINDDIDLTTTLILIQDI